MAAASSLRRSRFVVAVAVSAVLVTSAAFSGYVRSTLGLAAALWFGCRVR